ncbi:MAG: tRNA (N6-isopentenyl adenosine(37)-C2)-methylthiotransferase MiaB [Deltaproteobacteria bacterium]|nr:tRNA (N6-isopentenyl adenosine(37)-C2)-methylthiotransferase MiaB [Deltaproteobacteria bacterium]
MKLNVLPTQPETPALASTGKRAFIHTFGCQMNESDSARMAEILKNQGYAATPDAESADLILLNTCAIREKAEQKLFSALGRYRQVKLSRGALIGVAGCVAQQEKEALTQRVPYVDFVLGPDAIGKLPEILARVEQKERVVETAWMDSEEYVFPRADPDSARGKVSEFVTVMKGCNNVCAFCVVPRTRGREVSRPVAEVMLEVKALADVGVKEVTLLGQNVNSYLGGVDFAELLLRTAQVPGIERVRFTTSHPHDLSDALIEAFRKEPKIAPHFHLPVQSGSDTVLKRMRRDYTVEEYLERLARLRAARPDIAVTTDIIVGFPGETDDDFEKTMQLLERVRYDNIYSFVYSPRPRTSAIRHEEEWGVVAHDVKVARLERLQKRQQDIGTELARESLGQIVDVLVEGPSRTRADLRMGRTAHNRVVNFAGDAAAGTFARVKVEGARHNALAGIQVSSAHAV